MRFSTPFGHFEIDSLPSQVQVAVCHGFFIKEECRGKGLAHNLHQAQINKLIEDGYNFAICTVTGTNPAQSKALEQAGWHLSTTFYNSRTSNYTQFWQLDLSDVNEVAATYRETSPQKEAA